MRKQLSREEKIKKYKIPMKNSGRISLMDPDYGTEKMSPKKISDLILEYARMYPNSYVYLEKEYYDDYGGCTCDVGLYLCYDVERSNEEIDQLIDLHEHKLEIAREIARKSAKKRNEEKKNRQEKIWRQLCKERGIKLDNAGIPVDETRKPTRSWPLKND